MGSGECGVGSEEWGAILTRPIRAPLSWAGLGPVKYRVVRNAAEQERKKKTTRKRRFTVPAIWTHGIAKELAESKI